MFLLFIFSFHNLTKRYKQLHNIIDEKQRDQHFISIFPPNIFYRDLYNALIFLFDLEGSGFSNHRSDDHGGKREGCRFYESIYEFR